QSLPALADNGPGSWRRMQLVTWNDAHQPPQAQARFALARRWSRDASSDVLYLTNKGTMERTVTLTAEGALLGDARGDTSAVRGRERSYGGAWERLLSSEDREYGGAGSAAPARLEVRPGRTTEIRVLPGEAVLFKRIPAHRRERGLSS